MEQCGLVTMNERNENYSLKIYPLLILAGLDNHERDLVAIYIACNGTRGEIVTRVGNQEMKRAHLIDKCY